MSTITTERPADFLGNIPIEQVKEYAVSHARDSYFHGFEHWKRVAENGRELYTEGVNARVVELFAYLHDFCRQNDGSDYQHGPRAAEKIKEIRNTLLAELSDEEFGMLHDAIRDHTAVAKTDNITINACFDADRLDLGRVGIDPDPDRMATEKGRMLAIRRNGDC